MDLFMIVSLLMTFVAAWLVYSSWWRGGGGVDELPPGPPPLPIVGNIFQLGKNPHKSLSQLAKTYGPLMSLELGSELAVVASSPEMAREILINQSHVFLNRPRYDAARVFGCGEISVAMLPGNSDEWKKLRRLSKEKLLSAQALQLSQDLRQGMLTKLADHVSKRSGAAMDVGEATFTTMLNLMFATLFSTELAEYGSGVHSELQELIISFTRYAALPNISDFFPLLAPLDLQGIRRKTSRDWGRMLQIVHSMIEQRLKQRNPSSSTHYQKKNDFLETLLDLMEGNEYDLSIDEIKHLLMDLISGGSSTSSASIEWAMLELLLHPTKMAKLKAELKSVVGDRKRIIEESDISRLPYLQATIKESFRYHPVAPLLFPREAAEETRVNGFRIPKDTKAIINFWEITRDPSIWNSPHCFEPQSFLDNHMDFKGRHFELIAFGSGRRICPALLLASRIIHCTVATLCHNFDWELEEASKQLQPQLQREEVFGTALHKKKSLTAIPVEVSRSSYPSHN